MNLSLWEEKNTSKFYTNNWTHRSGILGEWKYSSSFVKFLAGIIDLF